MYTPSMGSTPDAANGNKRSALFLWREQQLRIKEVTFLVVLLLAGPAVFQSKARVGLCGLWQDSCNVEVAEGLEDPQPCPVTLPALDFLHLDRSTNGTAYQLICGEDA